MMQFQYKRPYHNLGWLFYRNMFDDRLRPQRDQHRLDFSFLIADNDEDKAKQKKALEEQNAAAFQFLCKEIVEAVYPEPSYPHPLGGQSWAMTTTYPGLLLGSGYAHETGVMGEFKLGFYFDATSGLPLVPGSTIKGVLRSAFPNVGNAAIQDKAAKAYGLWKALSAVDAEEFPARDWSPEYWSADPAPPEVQFIHALEQAIFDGVDVHATQAKKGDGPVYLSIYKRDIFHDAVIISATKGGAFLGMDFITPHLNRRHPELNAFTAPIPIQFLKLLPGVDLEFHFQLKDFHWGGQNLSAAQKADLFRAVLLSLGIGAKTNVGYGQFARPSTTAKVLIDHQDNAKKDGILLPHRGPANFERKLNVGDPMEAAVVDPNKISVRVIVKGEGYEVILRGNCPHQPGDLIRVKINQLDRSKARIVQVGYLGPLKQL